LVQHVDLVLMMRDGAVEMFGPRTDVLNRVIARPALDKRPTTEVSVVKVTAPARRERSLAGS
jgi:ABC-type protease/lipase transport system fused ATPase/permease subunit